MESRVVRKSGRVEIDQIRVGRGIHAAQCCRQGGVLIMHQRAGERRRWQRGVESSERLPEFEPEPRIVAADSAAHTKRLPAAGLLVGGQIEIASGGHGLSIRAGLQPAQQCLLRRGPLAGVPAHVREGVSVFVKLIPWRRRLSRRSQRLAPIIGEAGVFQAKAMAEFVGSRSDDIALSNHTLRSQPHRRCVENSLRRRNLPATEQSHTARIHAHLALRSHDEDAIVLR